MKPETVERLKKAQELLKEAHYQLCFASVTLEERKNGLVEIAWFNTLNSLELVKQLIQMAEKERKETELNLNARKCRWCATQPCPYPTDEDFRRQLEQCGQEWLETMPCWTPFPENVGTLHDKDGRLIQPVDY